MSDLVDIFLILAGLIELVPRMAILVILTVSLIGLFIFELLDVDFDDVAVPYLWRIVAKSRGIND